MSELGVSRMMVSSHASIIMACNRHLAVAIGIGHVLIWPLWMRNLYLVLVRSNSALFTIPSATAFRTSVTLCGLAVGLGLELTT